MTLAVLVANFAAGVDDTDSNFATGVVDTSGKFAAGVVNTGGAPWLANTSVNFCKKFEMTLLLLSEAWGKMIHEKNQKQKISWHCPSKRGVLNNFIYIVESAAA